MDFPVPKIMFQIVPVVLQYVGMLVLYLPPRTPAARNLVRAQWETSPLMEFNQRFAGGPKETLIKTKFLKSPADLY